MTDAKKAAGVPDAAVTGGMTLADAVEAFLLSRRVGNATAKTMRIYTMNLRRFAGIVAWYFEPGRGPNGTIQDPPSPPITAVTPQVVEQYLDRLARTTYEVVLPDGTTKVERRLTASSVHQHFRNLKTFWRWAVEAGLIERSPLRVRMKVPKTLPKTPDDDTVDLLMKHAGEGFWGARNRLLISLYADTGLRLTELLRVRLSDINLATHTIRIVGKGEVDDVAPFGEDSAIRLREYLRKYRWNTLPDDYLITDEQGHPIRSDTVTHILGTISRRAGLPHPVSPHKLRHYCGTTVLKISGDLELTRQTLRHRTLHMSLQYARLTKMDVLRKFRRASPIDNLKRR